MTDDASSNYSTTWELQSTMAASGIFWPAICNHIPCMAHIIQLALGAFTIALGVKAPTNSWETLEQDQQVGENGSTHIAKRQ
jgi:hypothetical protein